MKRRTARSMANRHVVAEQLIVGNIPLEDARRFLGMLPKETFCFRLRDRIHAQMGLTLYRVSTFTARGNIHVRITNFDTLAKWLRERGKHSAPIADEIAAAMALRALTADTAVSVAQAVVWEMR